MYEESHHRIIKIIQAEETWKQDNKWNKQQQKPFKNNSGESIPKQVLCATVPVRRFNGSVKPKLSGSFFLRFPVLSITGKLRPQGGPHQAQRAIYCRIRRGNCPKFPFFFQSTRSQICAQFGDANYHPVTWRSQSTTRCGGPIMSLKSRQSKVPTLWPSGRWDLAGPAGGPGSGWREHPESQECERPGSSRRFCPEGNIPVETRLATALPELHPRRLVQPAGLPSSFLLCLPAGEKPPLKNVTHPKQKGKKKKRHKSFIVKDKSCLQQPGYDLTSSCFRRPLSLTWVNRKETSTPSNLCGRLKGDEGWSVELWEV